MRPTSCISAVVLLVFFCFKPYAGMVSGRVLVKYNKQPVASAGIDLLKQNIMDPHGEYIYVESTTTDANGNYQFLTGSEGRCALSLHSNYCYAKDTIIGYFSAMTTMMFDFLVERKARVTVVVRNEATSAAVPNATVLLFGPLWSFNGRIPAGLLLDSLTTNASGMCQFSDLCPEPDYMVEVGAPKFIARTVAVVPVTDGMDLFQNIPLSPMAGVISGAAKSAETNGPISGAMLIRMSAPSIGRPMAIDTVYSSMRGGTYAFNNVTVGNYRIKSVKKGYSDTLSGVVSVITNNDSAFVPIVMRPVYMYVNGTITKVGTTDPIAGAFLSIKLFPYVLFGSGNFFSDTADASGNYGFKILKAYDSAKVFGAAPGFLSDSGKIVFSHDTTTFSFSLSSSSGAISPESWRQNGLTGKSRGNSLQVYSLSGKLLLKKAIAGAFTQNDAAEARNLSSSVVIMVLSDNGGRTKLVKRLAPRF